MDPQQPPHRPSDLPHVPGYNTPQIRLKRSGQFGRGSEIPAYATLPRSAGTARRAHSLIPGSPHAARLFPREASSTLPRKVSAPAAQLRPAPASPVTEPPHTVHISTTPLMKIHRISKEEQLAKQDARRRRKEEYFKTTPPDKLTITQKDLQIYVQFYENKLAGIVKDMDSNIQVERKKKDRLEARLKFLLDDNDSLAVELAGIKKDLKKCQILTETPV